MSNFQSPRTIVVTGATGNQGKGAIHALLGADEGWYVRALTRDVSSPWAKALLDECSDDVKAERLSLVQGSIYDLDSIRSTFVGAYGVFAATSEIYPGKVLIEEAEMAHEIRAGRNIVLAAKEAGVKHFVFSSLPNMDKVTEGKFPGIHHMNNKHAIEEFAKEHLSGVTCLIPGLFVQEPHRRTLTHRTFSIHRILLHQFEMASLLSTSVLVMSKNFILTIMIHWLIFMIL